MSGSGGCIYWHTFIGTSLMELWWHPSASPQSLSLQQHMHRNKVHGAPSVSQPEFCAWGGWFRGLMATVQAKVRPRDTVRVAAWGVGGGLGGSAGEGKLGKGWARV